MANLEAALAHHQYLREQLRVQFPDADDQTLADTLEGESDLDRAIAAVMRSAERDREMLLGLQAIMKERADRKAVLEDRIERKRDLVERVMQRAELLRVDDPEFVLTLSRRQQKLVILDETQIPEHLLAPQPPKPDREAIKERLKSGENVPGATLDNGGVGLTVRRK